MIEPVLLQDAVGVPMPVAFVLAMALVGVSIAIVVAFIWFLRGSKSATGI